MGGGWVVVSEESQSRRSPKLGVSKCTFLRDRCSKLADLYLGISPIYYAIMDHKRNQEVSLCLLWDLADIAWDWLNFRLKQLQAQHFSTQYHKTFKISSMYTLNTKYEIIEHLEQYEGRYRQKGEFAWQGGWMVHQISKSAHCVVSYFELQCKGLPWHRVHAS